MSGSLRVYFVAFAPIFISVIIRAAKEDDRDFRYISYDDLLPTIDRFSEINVISYSQLLFDIPRFQLIVGARDYLYRLSLKGLQKLEEAHWPATQSTVNTCQQKGQSEADCRNFIRVLLTKDTRIFTCGTYAFSPKCSWREIDNMNTVIEETNGIGKCPYSPHQNVTSVLSSNGDYYVGCMVDFSARDPAIFRFVGKTAGLRTVQYNHKWLSEPNFVASYDIGNFTYFVFRETAVEYISSGKIIYSRIARVCKNDEGGQYLLKDNWTTFLKARLNCSIPGEYPFYYNEIQSAYFLEPEGILYATFTTPRNSIHGSAVCAFNMSSITHAFHGQFKYQSGPSAIWEPHNGHQAGRHHFQCETQASSSHKIILESEKYQLMDREVRPVSHYPFVTAELEIYTKIVVDVIATQHYEAIHVLFVATSAGVIKKMMILPRTQQICLLEIIDLFPGDQSQPIRDLKILRTDSLYVGTDKSVMRIPVQRCKRFKTKRACLNAMDPYCGWIGHQQICDVAPQRNPLSSFWQQSFHSCPVLTEPMDGEWGPWGEWRECSHMIETSGNRCFCRFRECNSPSPKHGGLDCEGVRVQVSNCTQNGHWTEWSAWSDCSHSCGLARKTRRRICGNPEPAYGGMPCEGTERDVIYCTSNPPCPAPIPLSIDGRWSDWSAWNECSAPCGGGSQMRRRTCNNPSPQHGGKPCEGCAHDSRSCNQNPCSEHRRSTPWTPWLRGNNSKDGGYYQLRYRFTCKVNVPDAKFIRISPLKKEERFCLEDGRNCISSEFINNDGDWSEWSSWTHCSARCGGGKQFRERSCDSPPPNGSGSECLGEKRMERTCNPHPCKNLEGWSEWTEWSQCDAAGYQHRRRQCEAADVESELCQGTDRQTRMCFDNNEEPNDLNSMALSVAGIQVGHIVAASVCFFLLGAFVTGMGMFCYMRRQRKRYMRGNKHFINRQASPNKYVSPNECTPKNNQSNMSLMKNKEATIKRNGHKMQQNDELYE